MSEITGNHWDQKQISKLKNAIGKLRNSRNKAGIVKSIIAESVNTRPPSEFDQDPWLFGFTNGTYDLELGQLRAGRQEDYITVVADYEHKNCSMGEMKEIKKLVETILPVTAERTCVLKFLASALCAEMFSTFGILTGTGRNGKDTLVTGMLAATLGKHYITGNTTIITMPVGKGVCQELANMENKRAIVFSEPSADQTLQCANIKAMTGNPMITARGIYSKETAFKNRVTSIVLTNDIPPINNVDIASGTRIMVAPFRASFLNNDQLSEVPPGTKYVYPVDNKYKSRE